MDRCTIGVTLSREHVILSDNSNTLWCDRNDGRLTAGKELKKDVILEYADLGKIWGVVGKICFFTDGDWKLVVVTQASYVGQVPHGGEVYCVDKIGIIPLTPGSGIYSEIIGLELPEPLEQSLPGSVSSSGRPNSPTIRGVKNLPMGGPGTADKDRVKEKEKTKEAREREKVEKRLTEALLAMFNDSQSFYFCLDSDLSHSLQHQLDSPKQKQELPLWKRMEEKYFWNKWMLSELMNSDDNDLELSSHWIFPLIQGYVEVRQIPVLCEDTPTILQPGWSIQYREEREKLLLESISEEKERRARRGRGTGGSTGVEMELQDMATIDQKGMMIPLTDLSQPGYESGGGASASGEEDLLIFSPVRFTNKLEDTEKVARGIREVPAMGGTMSEEGGGGGGGANGWTMEGNGENLDGVNGREGEEEVVAASADGVVVVTARSSGESSSGDRTEDSRGTGSEGGGLTCPGGGNGQLVDLEVNYESPHQSARMSGSPLHAFLQPEFSGPPQHEFLQPMAPSNSPHMASDSLLQAEVAADSPSSHILQAKAGASNSLHEQSSQPTSDAISPDSILSDSCSQLRHHPITAESAGATTDPRSPPLQSSPLKDEDKCISSASSGSLFYTSQEVPDVDGVLIDLYESPLSSGGATRLPLSPEVARSSEDEGLTSQQLPDDLHDASPMGNPFLEEEEEKEEGKAEPPSFTLAIISRRSRLRAGTRYKRRGVDSEGNVANCVETELVLQCGSHVVSYVIMRGSVPVFWSQPGNKYHPLPVIEKTVEETQEAFKRHFDSQFELYKEMVAVNLVKQAGREKLVGDAFEQHVMLMDNPKLSYVAFDFHRSYKVNQSLALQNLLEGTTKFTRKFKYCWIDAAQSCGSLCRQEGVFRVNCMDCLDRTNVVESIISREVLQLALQKLGMIPFDEKLGGYTLTSYQEMWANNGDVVSKQYAGTAAMKGDITRYGERRITGLMKDGYNSAHRYYLNVFRDSYRQVLIDLMQGINPFEAFFSLPRSMQGMDELDDGIIPVPEHTQSNESAWSLEREEAMAEMIQVCKQELFPKLDGLPFSQSSGLTGWVLMEAAGFSFLGDNKEEEPCVVIHSKTKAELCIAKFNMESKKVLCFLRIPMAQIGRIVVGQLGTIIRNTKRLHMRLHYSLIQDTSCYFTFTTAIPTSTEEERAILISIAEMLAKMQPSISLQEQKITKKKSPPHKGIIYLLPPDSIQSFPNLSISEVNGRSQSESKSQEVNISLLNSGEEEEPSLSAPSSPKLKSPLRMKLAHSCEDLLSAGEVPGSPLHPPSSQGPSIKVTRVSKLGDRRASSTSREVEESDESDDSECEMEMISIANVGRSSTNLSVGVANPLLDVLGKETEEEEEEEPEQNVEEIAAEVKQNESSSSETSSTFGRLKGRFMKTVKSSNFLSKTISPQPSPEDSRDAGTSQQSPSPPPPERSDSKTSLKKASASPSLWRKMRRGSAVTPSQAEEEVSKEDARRNCKSQMIFL